MRIQFKPTLKIKNYIYFDQLKGTFLVPYHGWKALFRKPKVHSIKDIASIDILSDVIGKDSFWGVRDRCIEVTIMIIMKNNDRCYIDFLKKDVSPRGFKCKKAFKEAQNVKSVLMFMQKAGEYAVKIEKERIPYINQVVRV